MSEVVLRCPACGTTQSHPGECEACSESEVRFFCGNHNPGLWLDDAMCKICGVKFGDPPRRPPLTSRTPPRLPSRDTRGPVPRPPLATDAEPPRRVPRKAPTVADPEDTSAPSSLEELLVRTWEGRERARYDVEEEVWRGRTVETPRPALPIAGCLVRLVLFVFLLIVLGVGFLFLLLGSLS
jgi:hypothetical protein